MSGVPRWKRKQPWRTSKHGNRVTEYGGRKFHSAAEARRASELELMQDGGIITNLQEQVSYRFEVNGICCGEYRADFVFEKDGEIIVEDVKGAMEGDAWKLFLYKRALMAACYGVDVKIYRLGEYVDPKTKIGARSDTAGGDA